MRRRPLSTIGLACLLAIGSCYEDDTTGLSGRIPLTIVELTDAPFPYDSVSRVDLYVVSIAASTVLDTSDLNPAWQTIAEPRQRYNLLQLQGGVTDTLGGRRIPAGQYRTVRMVIDTDSSSITSKTGQLMPIDWQSSAGQPTLFAFVEDPIGVPDTGAVIVIDFDVGRSFLCDAPCSRFVFSPVFRAVNRAATGSISGRVTGDTLAAYPDPIRDVTVTVYGGDPSLPEPTWWVRATGKTDAFGYFRIAYLLPGTYILRADAPRASPFSPGVRSNVIVTAGVDVPNQGITLPLAPAGTVVVTPVPSYLLVGDSVVLTAQVVDRNGQPLPSPLVGWYNFDTTLARIFPLAGQPQSVLLKAYAAGTARIMVSAAGAPSTTLLIPVLAGPPPPGTVSTVMVSPASDSSVVRILALSGRGNPVATFSALGAGTATVRASTEGTSGTATVTVSP